MAERVFLADSNWAAPLLWRSEFLNVLTLYMRQEDMPLKQAKTTMERAEQLLAGREYTIPASEILQLTSESVLSAYDAEFVALAEQLDVLLVTNDNKILREASPRAVSLERFAQKS